MALKFPFSRLVSEADHITDAFTAHTLVMGVRLPAPYNADTIALTLTIVAQGAKQASDGADIGDLTVAQNLAMDALNARIKGARDTARRAFKGQTVKLHEEFRVGENSNAIDEVLERGTIISASLKRAENLAPMAAKGWMVSDTMAFDADLAALDDKEDDQEGARTVKLGTTATREENAILLYERLLTTQNAARLQFPDTVANTAVRALFRLGLFPPKGEEEELSLPEQALNILEDTAPGQVSMTMSCVGATTMRLFVLYPGATDFVLFAENLPMGLYVATGLAAGNHQFKAVGNNATGDGPESEAFSVTVS